ncbi:hypothetical protein MASR2M8_12170 [Opitutaceae bacterium]
MRPQFWLLLAALILGAAPSAGAADAPSLPPLPNLNAPELRATFIAFVQSQIEQEARAGNYSEHQRERTEVFCSDYMMVAVRAMFAEPVPGIRRQVADYRGELAGYLVIVLRSQFYIEDRRLRTLAVPAEEVGEVLYGIYQSGVALSAAALQATAELVLALHGDPVWRAAVAEKRFPEIALREFITSREQVWNAWEAKHPHLEVGVFQGVKKWFNEKTAGDLDYMEKVHQEK